MRVALYHLSGALRPALLCALVLLVPIVGTTGCFSSSSAEGVYLESRTSGRLVAFPPAKDNAAHIMRLQLLQFDSEVAGLVEFFLGENFDDVEYDQQTFEWKEPPPGYFCTRMDKGSVKDDNITFEFIDWLNRRWKVDASLNSDREVIAGRIERLRVNGAPLNLPEGDELTFLMPENAAYRALEHAGSAPENEELVLERFDSDVNPDDLRCRDYHTDDRLTLDLDDLDLENMGAGQGELRIALLVTRPLFGAGSMIVGLDTDEVLTATMQGRPMSTVVDVAVDIVDNEREVHLRVPPLPDFMTSGIAIGGFVIYEDLGTVGELDRGDPIWASGEEVIVYSAIDFQEYDLAGSDSHRLIYANDINGVRQTTSLFDSTNSPPSGWSAYQYAPAPVILGGEANIFLLQGFIGGPASTVRMKSSPQVSLCDACYPTPDDMPACSSCPAILPLLLH